MPNRGAYSGLHDCIPEETMPTSSRTDHQSGSRSHRPPVDPPCRRTRSSNRPETDSQSLGKTELTASAFQGLACAARRRRRTAQADRGRTPQLLLLFAVAESDYAVLG